MIIANNIQKTFTSGFWIWKQQTPVLKGFNFQALPGQVTGLLGPNGAGKTTFFRIIAGLEKPSAGTISVDGLDPWCDPKSMRGRIALLPEEAGVEGSMDGYNHLWVFGAMMGLHKEEIIQGLKQADQDLNLNSFWTRPFSTYSRGQKARIALARLAMMPDASVFIFDEPSNGLDFESVARLHQFIRRLANEGKTVLVASHILSDLRHLCDRLVGIDAGRTASPERLDAWMKAHAKNAGMVNQSSSAPAEEVA